mmetsp:Transcript_28142/g.53270  ORF Transcript_28142/g.53270 Transcript_28142/m.53270 type:complete len:112 (+) Transcript_28142:279-614(+)|eukprot:CAMPEP_0182497404 /NCGR_PEP_ID=MMETSP1321-20130603/5879_1 /TAXON_ID=91990 /ORGANISM="Bolidomonas sp., Strain RCC1657" /LENGTH=111 /DNA_ID=CAMNT_0024701261 /DNA_START=252 /DNA_END=587 /DNA_ORIENTATION=-
MEILSSPNAPDLLTNHEVLTLLSLKSPSLTPFQSSCHTYLTSLPSPTSPPSLLQNLSHPSLSLENSEILQLVNLMPDNIPLLNVILPEVEERFEDGVEGILEIVEKEKKKK